MKSFLLGSLVFGLSTFTVASETIHWGYDHEISPEHWGELNENFKECSSGKNQTPIDIRNTYQSVIKHKLNIQYKVSPNDIIFNGHTVQVNTKKDDQSDYLILDGQKFFLKQFHFHTPSENQIEGRSYPLELHFVNANAQGDLTVLAVMFVLGEKNPEWDKLWIDLSSKENDDRHLSHEVNLNKLLPKNLDYYRFSGSLTTPPCSEGVNWVVLKNPLTISEQQLKTFKVLLKNQDNHRPIQPTHGRVIIED